jgi:hypothetical protein
MLREGGSMRGIVVRIKRKPECGWKSGAIFRESARARIRARIIGHGKPA